MFKSLFYSFLLDDISCRTYSRFCDFRVVFVLYDVRCLNFVFVVLETVFFGENRYFFVGCGSWYCEVGKIKFFISE